MEGDSFQAGEGPITGPNDKRNIGKRSGKREGKMCEGGVRETPAVIDTQGESGRRLASLISCPKSVYGLEQTQHTWCARDSQTASNGHREGGS